MVHAFAIWKSALLTLGWTLVSGKAVQQDETIAAYVKRIRGQKTRFAVPPLSKEWLRLHAADSAKRRFDR